MTRSHPAAIAGLGMTPMGKVFGSTGTELAADAVRLAVADAGLTIGDIDGLMVSTGITNSVGMSLARVVGLNDLEYLAEMNSYGASAGVMISAAAQAIESGTADAIVCVFADAPIRPDERSGARYSSTEPRRGLAGLRAAQGFVGATPMYALAARRHMQTYGTTSEQFGAVAVAQRAWAVDNPLAQFREPITLEDHQQSRWIADPLHLLDCCVVSNGAVAVIVTSGERAASLAKPPVYLLGWGQSHPGSVTGPDGRFGLVTGAARSGPAAMKMAEIRPGDVDVCELYDCYTYTVIVTLEDYGFCAKGEGGAFAASGALARGGSLPTNTGGGQLSSYYMWGYTPLSEAIIQARGEGGARQVERHDIVLVSGNGGILDHHSTLVLSPHERAA